MFYILPSLRIKFKSGPVDFYFIHFCEKYEDALDWVREQTELLR